MKARPIRTRDELFAALRPYCPTKSCGRAIDEGRAIVLGGFTVPGSLSCWIIRVVAHRGQRWFIGFECDGFNYTYRVRHYKEDEVPWAHWDGKPDGTRPLIDGDIPEWVAQRQLQEVGRVSD